MNSEQALTQAIFEASHKTDNLIKRLRKTKYEYYKEGEIICARYYSFLFSKLEAEKEHEIEHLRNNAEDIKKQIEALRNVANEYKKKKQASSSAVPTVIHDMDFNIILEELDDVNKSDSDIMKALNAISIKKYYSVDR